MKRKYLNRTVKGLDEMTTQFHGVKTAPRAAIAKRASKTKTLPPAVKTVMSLLRNSLDKEMLMFKKSNPDFYAGHVSARVIVDRGDRTATSQPTPAPTPQTQVKTKFDFDSAPRRDTLSA